MTDSLVQDAKTLLLDLGIDAALLEGGDLAVGTPLTGETLARVPTATADAVGHTLAGAAAAFRGLLLQ